MKHRIFFILALFGTLSFASWQATAQTAVRVVLNDGSEQTFSVSEEGKLYFSETSLFINENQGAPTSVLLASIRKLTFGSQLVSMPEDAPKEAVVVYPNPAIAVCALPVLAQRRCGLKSFRSTASWYWRGNILRMRRLVSGIWLRVFTL